MMANEFKKLQENENVFADDLHGWGRKPPQEYKEIVLRQIEECRKEGSKQLIPGGQFGIKTERGYVPVQMFDQRKIYNQCVLSLYDLMIRYFDEEIEEKIKPLFNGITDKWKEVLDYFIQHEPHPLYQNQAKVLGEMPATKLGSNLLNSFENFKHEQHRKIYQELLLLFDRKNELSGKRTIKPY